MENENASAYVLLTSPEGSPRGLHYEWSGAQYGSLLQFNLLPGWPPACEPLTIASLCNLFPGSSQPSQQPLDGYVLGGLVQPSGA